MNRRLWFLNWFFAGLLLVIALRVAYLQLWDGPNSGAALAAKAVKFRTQVVPGEEFYRGEILDRNLQSLTDSWMRPTLVAFPAAISEIGDTAERLQQVLGLPAGNTETVIKRALETNGLRAPLILKVNLAPEEVAALEETHIEGLAVLPIKTRYGPGSLARHLIGHLNSISEKQWQKFTLEKRTAATNPDLPTAYLITDKMGVAGLESKFEQALKGARPESRLVAVADANGRLLQGLGYKKQAEETDPWRNHLVLSLDRRYQEIVEKTMDDSMVRGAVVVIDISTGDVLAAASRPNFDQNQVGKYLTGVDELIDRTERVAFYPGSVFKMVVAAAALEEKLVTPGEVFTCTGSYSFNDQTQIKCLHEHGPVTLAEAIGKSCNTTFVQLGLRLGPDKLVEYAARLGFVININNQSPPAKVGNASIGQEGVLVSPMQIANLYATIARGGYYQSPRIVKEIRNNQGEVIQEYPLKPPVRVISTETCDILREALVQAVQTGSGRAGWVEKEGTAGKTGTAQANDEDKVIAWFAGFSPIDNPRLAIAVMVEENSQGAQTQLRGGDNAAPVFKQVAQAILELEKQ